MQTRKIILWAALSSVLIIAVAGTISVRYLLYPRHPSAETVTIIVSKGTTVRAIADSLVHHRIIIAKAPFLLWIKYTGIEKKIQAGRYVLNPGEGALSAADKLTKALPCDILLTIPEGLTIEQTAARIALTLPIDTAEFIALCRDTAFIRRLGILEIESLEGYLFPDSYRLLESAGCSEIISRLTSKFLEVYPRLDSLASAPIALSRHEIVTLASIVEKEAAIASERPRIAGVFYNRLRLHVPLGADPTVRYLFKKFNGPLYVSELNSSSPYNTRRFAGLPPGPICSPGFASLFAAVSPLKTNELYFVAKWDGSGAHEFSITNAEHTRKKMEIRRRNERRLRGKAGS